MKTTNTKKFIKVTAIILASVIGTLLLTVLSYVFYVLFEYDRIEDNLPVAVTDTVESELNVNTSYTAVTYNVGFGAYSPEYSFFMDVSYDDHTGKKVSGKYGKGISKEDVEANTSGAVNCLKQTNADFILLQEVDEKANRSYFVNQREAFTFSGYNTAFAVNFHSAYLFYPFNDPIGKSLSGIMTLSKHKIQSTTRRSLPLATDFSKFFDLDRCISVSRLPVAESDRELVLINVHLSAYDEGGVIRAQQTEMFMDILSEEYQKGNYVVAGGDFNQLLSTVEFPNTQHRQDWVSPFPTENLPEGYSVHTSTDKPTCRNANMPYVLGQSYTCIIDGFITSANVSVSSAKTVISDFEFSDHNPVSISFTLNT